MPTVGDHIATKQAKNPENEDLCLPSSFSQQDRLQLALGCLAEKERQLCEGSAFDTIRSLQTAVKIIVALRDQKRKHAYGQDRNTRALAKIRDAEYRRDLLIADYNAARTAMISLGMDGEFFPFMKVEDTFRKSTTLRPAVGDSCKMDGLLWTMTGVNSGSFSRATSSVQAVDINVPVFGTQVSKAAKRQ